MLDSMIKMLETVEKIEKLGEAINVDGGFNLESFSTINYNKQREALIEMAEADDKFKKDLESFVLDGISFWELLNKDGSELNEQ